MDFNTVDSVRKDITNRLYKNGFSVESCKYDASKRHKNLEMQVNKSGITKACLKVYFKEATFTVGGPVDYITLNGATIYQSGSGSSHSKLIEGLVEFFDRYVEANTKDHQKVGYPKVVDDLERETAARVAVIGLELYDSLFVNLDDKHNNKLNLTFIHPETDVKFKVEIFISPSKYSSKFVKYIKIDGEYATDGYYTPALIKALEDKINLTKTSETDMQIQKLTNLMLPNLKTVTVSFNAGQQSGGYSFKTNLDLVVGDRVVVCTGKSDLKVAKVVEIDDQLNDSATAWVVSKLDLTEYRRNKAIEKKINSELTKVRQEHSRRQAQAAMCEAMGVGIDDLSKSITNWVDEADTQLKLESAETIEVESDEDE